MWKTNSFRVLHETKTFQKLSFEKSLSDYTYNGLISSTLLLDFNELYTVRIWRIYYAF